MRRACLQLWWVAGLAGCAPVELPGPASRVVQYDAASRYAVCAPVASVADGEHCRCGSDCAGPGSTCLTEEVTGMPGGLCAASCFNGTSCPTGYQCSDTVCYRSCQTNADCGAQSYCLIGRCTPMCLSNADCQSGNCNPYLGNCLPPGQTAPGGGLDARCTQNSDCKSNYCLYGHCATACSTEVGTCPEGGVCWQVEGEMGICYPSCDLATGCAYTDRRCEVRSVGQTPSCLPTTNAGCFGPTPSPTAGHKCGCDADCDPGSTCLTESVSGLPQGICAVNCQTDADCPGNDQCAQVVGFCFPRCTLDDVCELGRLCGWGACLPYCVLDSECLSGKCDRYTGQCVPGPATGGGVQAACARSSDCKSEWCSTSTPHQCITWCSTTRGVCPEGALCVPGGPTLDSGWCAKPCNTDADCPQQGLHCVATGNGQPNHCE